MPSSAQLELSTYWLDVMAANYTLFLAAISSSRRGSRVFKESLKGVSMKMQWAFKCASSRVAVKFFCKGASEFPNRYQNILKKNFYVPILLKSDTEMNENTNSTQNQAQVGAKGEWDLNSISQPPCFDQRPENRINKSISCKENSISCFENQFWTPWL